jgi:hypothetical protein
VRHALEVGEVPEVGQPVEDDDLVARGHEALDEVAAEKAAAAGDEDAHAPTRTIRRRPA